MYNMLHVLNAREGEEGDFWLDEEEQVLCISSEFALNADWTDMYFKAFVKIYGPMCTYQEIINRIEKCKGVIEKGDGIEKNSSIKDDLKYITDKMLSNSYKSGFANIRDRIKNPEVYENLKSKKINVKMEPDEILKRLSELEDFLEQPLCRETFCMKSIIYNYINRFWNGKSFLLRANAAKDMREMFEKDFSKPLKDYLQKSHEKAKEYCIECNTLIDSKEKISIAFMNDMADDLSRKRSAFWNCKVDAYICPLCAYLYALVPLGFRLVGNKFVFQNIDYNIKALTAVNKTGKVVLQESAKHSEEKYTTWVARTLNTIFELKIKELNNIPVILRGTNAEDTYIFNILYKDILNVLKDDKIMEYLEKLSEHPNVKIKNDFLNVYESSIENLINYNNQYRLINRLIKASIETESILSRAVLVFKIQITTFIIMQGEGDNTEMNVWSMRNSGYELRKAILAAKGEKSDECMRGTIYRLTNALSVGNTERFMDMIIRLYTSMSNKKANGAKENKELIIPNGFVDMLQDREKFNQYGYAFILGLKGSHYVSKEENENG
ncbi:type I-B CRISPR-associated protein Cas8b1/Cst1 [Eubacterium sp. MSJ-13]|nr:type I-B CRISPR-associated protein Cas8b1/Cst1 [Eubacterium sp. MSJ-13]